MSSTTVQTLDDAPGKPRAAAGAPAGPLTRALRSPLTLGLLGVAFLIALWQLTSGLGLVARDSLPAPWTVALRIKDLAVSGDFRLQVLDTVYTWFLSMALTAAVAVPLGIVLGTVAALYRPTVTVVHALRSVPATVFIPASVLLFGLGLSMKLALTVFAIFGPILLNTVYGVHNTEPQLLTVARSMRWSRFQILRRVVLPSALPSIVTGIRVASGIALIVIVSVELLGASYGIGTVIVKYQGIPRPDFVYAGIILAGVLGWLLYTTLAAIERRSLPWTRRGADAGGRS
ncbi:ABC transporter permease [Actinomadura sp. GC306]|uniref:ABC transporter permease n=1 Tax=Actinomadura sp. GC306 TaxID=2530367 RepID=UPI0014045E80|nr:ABC transporter permease [Actinomadura sp. GC306]